MNSQDLQVFEQMVRIASSPETPDQERRQSFEAINKFTQFELWAQNLFVLKESKNEGALTFAAGNLSSILTTYINSFSPDDRVSIRQTILNILASLSFEMWNSMALQAINDCFCRLQKFCWFDSTIQGTNALVAEMLPFIRHSVPHSIVGIKLLSSLVFEISHRLPSTSAAKQRKISVLFRESTLLDILRLGLSHLQGVLTMQATNDLERHQFDVLLKQNLYLIHQVLHFDFIGTEPDESLDTISVIHVPNTWTPFFDSCDSIRFLFSAYDQVPAHHSAMVLEILEVLARIRSSVFSSNEMKTSWLNELVDGVGGILMKKKCFDKADNRHTIARILVAIKTCWQFPQLLECKNYKEFIKQTVDFSVTMFTQSENFNSTLYVFGWWAKMVTAAKMIKSDDTLASLTILSFNVVQAFVQAQLQHVNQPISTEEPLASEHLTSLLTEFPNLTKNDYLNCTSMLFQGLQIVAKQYHEAIQIAMTQPQALMNAEKGLAWLVYLTSASLSGRMKAGPDKDREDQLDGQILCTLFECLTLHDNRMIRQGPTPASEYLEAAFISFLQTFCRQYVSEASFASNSAVYHMLAKQVELTTPNAVVERVVGKILMILEAWKDNETILVDTLHSDGLFWALATGFSSSKFVSESPLIIHILEHHAELKLAVADRTRRAFYKTLARLLFSVENNNFLAFVTPWSQRIDLIQAALANRTEVPKACKALISIFNDLRGVISSIYSKDKGYVSFFEWFHQETQYHEWTAQLLAQAAQIGLEDDECIAIIRFSCEFATNDHQRISFPPTSSNGVRLFRTTSTILCNFGTYIQARCASPNTQITDLFRLLKYYMKTFIALISGGYTNFGVFEMYNDPVLSDLIQMTLKILLAIDLDQLEKFPKLFSLVYQTIGPVASNHQSMLVKLDSTLYGQFLGLLLRGLQTDIKSIITIACAALDKLFSRHIRNLVFATNQRSNPNNQEVQPMSIHLERNQNILNFMMIQFINIILTIDNIHWTIAKPLLCLIIICQNDFKNIQQLLVASQAHDAQKSQQLQQAFALLMEEILPTLDESNREKFTGHVGVFKNSVTNFIDLGALYKTIVQFTKE